MLRGEPVASHVVSTLAIFIPISSPDDPTIWLTSVGFGLLNLLTLSLVGVEAPAAADGSRSPLRVGWAVGRRSAGRIALGLVVGPGLMTLAWLAAHAALADAVGLDGLAVEGDRIQWIELPLLLLYMLSSLFAALLAVVVLCNAYRGSADQRPA